MTVSVVYGHVNHTIILGAGYSSDLLVHSGASVLPGDTNPAFNYIGIASFVQNATLTNAGYIGGSNGLTEPGHGGNAGIGVNLALAGDKLINDSVVTGGYGGSSTGAGSYGNYGGSGGIGVNLISTGATSANNGRISGGNGGNGSLGYGAGTGGVGVGLSGGTLNNTLNIEGGNGGYSKLAELGAAGGTGVEVGSGGILNNLGGAYSASIRGGVAGSAYNGGQGGMGVDLAAGATLNNGFAIYGGTGANTSGGNGATSFGDGGAGGVGVHLSTGAAATLTGSSKIYGGFGGNGYLGGNGGNGLTADANILLSNAGTIHGGTGGWGYSGFFSFGITYAGGVGGSGVVLTHAFLLNTGTISGGQGGKFGQGGVGVYLNGGTLVNSGTIAGGVGGGGYRNYSVKFGPQGGTLVAESTAHFGPTYLGNYGVLTSGGIIGGFAPGDTINIANMTPAQVTAHLSPIQFDHLHTYYASLTTPTGGTLTLDLTAPQGSSVYGETFSLTSNGGTGTDITLQAACYRRGTRILTPRGEVPIEELRVGEAVLTVSGGKKPIRWLGSRRIDCLRHPAPAHVWPIKIAAGALGPKTPTRDLWVSPGHSLYLDGVLIQAEKLVNCATIEQVPQERVEYWHVELDAHDLLVAEGAPSESYLDTGNRTAFANGGKFIEAYPDFAPKHWSETCVPLIMEGDLIERAKRSLCERAIALGYTLTADADLHVLADGERIEPIELGHNRVAFMIPPQRHAIEMCSRTFVPTHIQPSSRDTRPLGACITQLQIDGMDVSLDDEAVFAHGWHDLENSGEAPPHRWGTGRSPLPAAARLVVVECTQGRHFLIRGGLLQNADSPVNSRPTVSWCTDSVPS